MIDIEMEALRRKSERRDLFAMAALIGLLAQNARTDESPWNDYESLAEQSVKLADVMMKASAKDSE